MRIIVVKSDETKGVGIGWARVLQPRSQPLIEVQAASYACLSLMGSVYDQY
jgi:hypothetical protein